MNALMIPFFLVAHMGGETGNLEHVYEARAQVLFRSSEPEVIRANMTFETEMYCRPKSEDRQVCHFTNGTMYIVDGESPEVNRPFAMYNEPFELKFNENGAEEIIVEKGLETEIIDILRSWVRQLTIGTDLTGKTEEDGEFEVEKTNVEDCKMNVKLRYDPPGIEKDEQDKRPYTLEPTPRLNKPENRSLEITKNSVLDSCEMKHSFAFDTMFFAYSEGKHKAELVERLEVLKQMLAITDKDYASITHRFGYLGSKDDETVSVAFAESVALRLKFVRSVDDPLPTIQDPETHTVVE